MIGLSLKIKYLILIISLFFTSCAKKQTYSYRTYNQKGHYTANTKVKNSNAMHKATMRPYKIRGIMYYPSLVSIGDTFDGIASWYGPNFHAKKTSNGEIYNMYALTAAHKTLPMNTIVLVKNIENNKQVVVRINDRGPFVDGRIIDLSNLAARRIDMIQKGTARVKLTIIGFYGHIDVKKTNQQISAKGYMLQIGAFRNKNGAKKVKQFYQNKINQKYKIIIKKGWSLNIPIYRVFVLGFKSKKEVNNFIRISKISGKAIAIRRP